MKNNIITAFLITASIGISLLASLAIVKYFTTETIHTVVGTVTEINRYSDFMFVNVNGKRTGFYGTKEFSEGDLCCININTHGTGIIFDDEIISVTPYM